MRAIDVKNIARAFIFRSDDGDEIYKMELSLVYGLGHYKFQPGV